jgi:hypothetical protein
MYVQEIFLDESGEYAKQATKPFCISSKCIGPSVWVTACGCFLVPEESSKTWSQTNPADVSWFRKKVRRHLHIDAHKGHSSTVFKGLTRTLSGLLSKFPVRSVHSRISNPPIRSDQVSSSLISKSPVRSSEGC